jgi:ribonuclease T2
MLKWVWLHSLCSAAMVAAIAWTAAASDDSPPIDHYVLALSWQPTFCEFNADKPECRSLKPGSFAATRLAIHGLWPDSHENKRLRHCGVDAAVVALDEPARWCQLPEPELKPETRAALDLAMPGVRSCLDRHEWIEHGTCAGVDAEGYFATTLRLAAAVRASPLGDLLAANVSREVPRRKLIEAFDAAFGAGSAKALTLLCKPSGTKSLLIEIRIALERSAADGDLDGADLRLAGTGSRGSCPAMILIDPVGP